MNQSYKKYLEDNPEQVAEAQGNTKFNAEDNKKLNNHLGRLDVNKLDYKRAQYEKETGIKTYRIKKDQKFLDKFSRA